MAASVVEREILVKGNVSGRVRVSGTTSLSGGTASFTIVPGNNTVNITNPINSIGLRRIDCWGIACGNEDVASPQVVKSYSSVSDSELLTVTAEADQFYVWWVEGEYVGA